MAEESFNGTWPIFDVTPEKLTFRLFTWRPPTPVEEIDTMDPVITYEMKGRGGIPETFAA